MRQRGSIRGRMLAAFALLALGLGLTLGLAGLLSYDRLGAYLVGWHARPVMEALMEAERRAWAAEDRGRRHIYYGEDLAAAMHWRFLAGKQVPPAWERLSDGLHFFGGMEEFVLLVRRDGVTYALSGHTGMLQPMKARLGGVLLVCALAGLAVAVLLAVLLSRGLTRPLSRLTSAVEGRDRREPGTFTPLPPDLVNLNDEVGVLARALAAREAELRDFVRRESFFTGDVSHELRTPLTIMQGGLEILELRLASLPGAAGAELAPLLERLTRTTASMAATTRTLLLLARRPEALEREALDMGAALHALIREDARGGLLRLAGQEAPGQGRACPPQEGGPVLLFADMASDVWSLGQKELARIVFKNLLDNARRYTENGRVYLRLTPGMLEVRNGGRIPENLDIFARGVRGPARQERQEGHSSDLGASAGSGLGLSLVLRACEHLGWRLERHTAAPEAETVFRVLFPPFSAAEGDEA
ncbi:HAMP domain-containing sensor histidine kinase [uncultured Desulfovibrio sp.]|uniref:histidine kinase dimerization/phospho-acceptor domain-containing protein n=1 Tax=uncultured Desulfovibrio sp. TaxID=167968 RepID=UPI00271216C5|nr:HAMP domain-containing sensor histidine kinase [uncultured Desulfovibrio sp.]